MSLRKIKAGDKEICLVASDLEGCITPKLRTELNLAGMLFLQQYCKETNRRFEKKENEYCPIILVTGRSSYAESGIQSIGALGPAFTIPSVIENGALYWDHNEKKIHDYHPLISKNKSDIETVNEFVEDILKNKYKENARKEPGKEICISLNPIELDIKSLYQMVVEDFQKKGLDGIVNITHSASAVDITPKGVDKWSGLSYLLSLHDINPLNVLGVGDTKGDVPWIKHIGVPTAPQNATEDLRSQIPNLYVSSMPDAAGLAEILYRFIINNADKI